MALHINLGRRGEDMAAAYLLQNDYTILHRNWRSSYYEIDIIALKNEVIHFVEVKIRSSKRFGWPEEAVNKKKFQRLLQAANAFLYQHPLYRHVQYDVLAIIISNTNEPEYLLIEDVYL